MRNVKRKNIITLRKKGTKTVPLGALFDCLKYDGWAGNCIVLQKLLMVTKASKAAKAARGTLKRPPKEAPIYFSCGLFLGIKERPEQE